MALAPVTLSLLGATVMPQHGAFHPLVLDTTAGAIEARLYEAPEGTTAILWLGDATGGFDSPADQLFDRLAEQFQEKGVFSLRLQYRQPNDLAQSGLDGMVATFLLLQQGLEHVIVVGHGAGAFCAVQVAAHFPAVVGAALLAPHPEAQKDVEKLSPRPVFVAQGRQDKVVSPHLARAVAGAAKEPKQLVEYPGAGHDLSEAADKLSADLTAWLDGLVSAART